MRTQKRHSSPRSYTITVYTDSDGNRVAQMQTGSTYSTATTVSGTSISKIKVVVGKNETQANRIMYMKNLAVTQEAAVTTYAATFKETHGATPTVTVYSDSAMTTSANASMLEAGTYYFKAVATGYEDYTGSFEITDADKEVSFTMTAKTAISAVVNAVISGTETSIGTYSNSGYDSVRVFYPAYIKYEGAYYTVEANSAEPYYGKDFAASGTETISYTLDSDVAYYGEETDLTLGRSFAATDILTGRMSMGNCGRIYKNSYGYTGIIDSENDATYTVSLTARNVGSSTSSIALAVRDADGNMTAATDADGTEVSELSMATGGPSTSSVANVYIPAGCSLVFDNRSNSNNNNLAIDYFTLSNKSIVEETTTHNEAFTFTKTASELGASATVTVTLQNDTSGATHDITDTLGTSFEGAGEAAIAVVVTNIAEGLSVKSVTIN